MNFKILKKRILTPLTKLFVIDAQMVAKSANAGQFVIIRVHEKGERIPITITDFDSKNGTITLVIQEVGKTSKLAGSLQENESILDLVGPLGKPAPIRKDGHVVCVGGGFGSAALFTIIKALKANNVKVSVINGARTKDLVLLEEELKNICDEQYVCTDDGTYGYHGFVTGKLTDLIKTGTKIDEVIAIGPMPMMRATSETTKPYGLLTYVSLDPIMVDGTGMCGACRVTVSGSTKFACVDGPIFSAHEVDFNEAVRRSKMYVKEQEISLKRMEV